MKNIFRVGQKVKAIVDVPGYYLSKGKTYTVKSIRDADIVELKETKTLSATGWLTSADDNNNYIAYKARNKP